MAFSSAASNLVAGDTNGIPDVFVKDLTTGMTTRVSTDSRGRPGGRFFIRHEHQRRRPVRGVFQRGAATWWPAIRMVS